MPQVHNTGEHQHTQPAFRLSTSIHAEGECRWDGSRWRWRRRRWPHLRGVRLHPGQNHSAIASSALSPVETGSSRQIRAGDVSMTYAETSPIPTPSEDTPILSAVFGVLCPLRAGVTGGLNIFSQCVGGEHLIVETPIATIGYERHPFTPAPLT